MSQQTCSKTFFDDTNGTIFTCPLTPEQMMIIGKGVYGVAKDVFSNNFKEMTVQNHLKSMRVSLLVTAVIAIALILWVGWGFMSINHITLEAYAGISFIGILIVIGLLAGAHYYLQKSISSTFDNNIDSLVQAFQTSFGSFQDIGDASKPIGKIFAAYQASSSPACPCSYSS